MELSDLKGLGPTRLNRLHAMGISSLRDLLYFFPVRYEDHTRETPLSQAWEGELLVRGTVREKPGISYYRGLSRVTARLWNGTEFLPLVWFNEPWMVQQLPLNQDILLYGRIQAKDRRRSMQNPKIITEKGWFPVYRTIRGLPGRTFHQMMREAMSAVGEVCPETLPESLRVRHGLLSLADALSGIHFPKNAEHLLQARRRLDFESMLIYMTGVSLFQHQARPGSSMNIRPGDLDFFWSRMPYRPTSAQERVLREIAADLNRDQAMSRLVQGDVGCGKTLLAFGAIYLARKSGFQAAMMAPTEVLAHQHYENARQLLEPLGVSCELLTGSTRAAERRRVLKSLREGTCGAVFGTHALISEGVEYQKLGLVITDEQHRFGVRQRSSLQEKGENGEEFSPHVLVISATPIPRSLALILYGDLDLSLVDELPPGRKPVRTRLVPPEKREDLYRYLKSMAEQGQQGYVVCPLAEDSETLPEVKSAEGMLQYLSSGEFSALRAGRTWGQQKSAEKNETLRRFSAGELDVLVATTVIEVGINVPNATLMIVENAERFGLSQLHQLRGRVGRGEKESWCFLVSDASGKLRILCETGDGFEIAKKDLEIRGPGDLMGTRQSGDAAMGIAGGGDMRLLDEVQACVRDIMENPERAEERLRVEKLCRSFFDGNDFRIALN